MEERQPKAADDEQGRRPEAADGVVPKAEKRRNRPSKGGASRRRECDAGVREPGSERDRGKSTSVDEPATPHTGGGDDREGEEGRAKRPNQEQGGGAEAPTAPRLV